MNDKPGETVTVTTFSRPPHMLCQHDFKFSHYEGPSESPNSTIIQKTAVMICSHCGEYRKQEVPYA